MAYPEGKREEGERNRNDGGKNCENSLGVGDARTTGQGEEERDEPPGHALEKKKGTCGDEGVDGKVQTEL